MDKRQEEKAISWLSILADQAEYDSVGDTYTLRVNGIAMAALRSFLEELHSASEV